MSNAANNANNGEKNVIKVTGKEIVELVKKSEASRLGLTGYDVTQRRAHVLMDARR